MNIPATLLWSFVGTMCLTTLLATSQALGVTRRDAPIDGRDQLTVLGKGNKRRSVPILPQVSRAIAEYLALCPRSLAPEGPLFIAAVLFSLRSTPGCRNAVMRRQ